MQKTTKTFLNSLSLWLLPLLGASLIQTASAQYLTSAKAGFVNRIEGKAHIQRQASEQAEMGRASFGTQMRDGDLLTTAADSRVEVLLSPGSYLRMDEKTKVRAVNTALTEMSFELVAGSAIVEVGSAIRGTVNKKTALEILTPQGPVAIAKEGLYRFDAKGAMTIVSVHKGELFLGTREELLVERATKLKSGKSVRLTGASALAPEVAKLDKKAFDDFDQWSFARAEMLVAANYSVLRRSRSSSALAHGWLYDPFYNCYTFIPGSWQIISPYGFGFYRRFSDCSCSLPYYHPYYGSGPYYSGGATAGGTRPSPAPRVAPGSGGEAGRAPVHREIPPNRRIDPDSPRGVSRPDFGSSRGSYGSAGPSRSVDSGGGASRSSGGGSSGGGARHAGASSPRIVQ